MKVRLIPQFSSDSEALVFSEGSLVVGRAEKPFAKLPDALICGLAERHARFFIEGQQLYVVDLGRSGGTSVNGQPVGESPVPLADGDLVVFSKTLGYKVEIRSEQTAADSPEFDLRLVLTPLHDDADLDTIVVSAFPFLIGKDNEAFARYRDRFADEVGFLSRRHACIDKRGRALYLEDLGSTNGTFINGEALVSQRRKLVSGDTVAFGGEFFAYSVEIESASSEVVKPPAGGKAPGNGGGEKTTFITTPTSFLEIFYVDQQAKDQAAADDAPAGKDSGARETTSSGSGSPSPNRAGFRRLFFNGQGRWRRGVLAGIGGGVLAGVLLAGWIYLGASHRQLVESCEQGEHERCLRLAVDSLKKGKADEQIEKMAVAAFLQQYLPSWIDRLKTGAFPLEKADMAVLRERAEAINGVPGFIDLLQRIERLEHYVEKRGGVQGSVKVDHDEAKIESILTDWEEGKDQDRRLMIRMIEAVPAFDGVRARLFSHLRQLRNDESLYLPAIRKLKEDLAAASGDADTMADILARFESRYTRVTGLEPYYEDLRAYRRLADIAKEKLLLKQIVALDAIDFKTDLFQRIAEQKLQALLPPPDVVSLLRQALNHWLAGRSDEAWSVLERIDSDRWKALARAEIERQKSIVAEFQRLGDPGNGDGSNKALVDFYGKLDPLLDRHFLDAVAGELDKNRELIVAGVTQALGEAREQWQAYLDAGGISSIDRLEERVTARYRTQARRLASANAIVAAVVADQARLGLDIEAKDQALIDAITRELELQRQALQDLQQVHSERLLESKMRLLSVSGGRNQ